MPAKPSFAVDAAARDFPRRYIARTDDEAHQSTGVERILGVVRVVNRLRVASADRVASDPQAERVRVARLPQLREPWALGDQGCRGCPLGRSQHTILGLTLPRILPSGQPSRSGSPAVRISSVSGEGGERARRMITGMTEEPEVGRIYEGVVKSTTAFGAFVEILPGTEGLCHISELAEGRVANTEDVVKRGDVVRVKLLAVDEKGRLRLSRKAATAEEAAPAGAAVG